MQRDNEYLLDILEAAKLALSYVENKSKEDFTLIIEGREIKIQSGKIIRTMDTAADGWTAKMSWIPGEDKKLDRILRPYSYSKASVYLGSTLNDCP